MDGKLRGKRYRERGRKVCTVSRSTNQNDQFISIVVPLYCMEDS